MNLHLLVSPAIGTVNPQQSAGIQPNTGGYTTAPNGQRTPVYGTAYPVIAQVQALTSSDLAQLDALNVTSSTHKLWISGALVGVNRTANKGGDLVTLSDGNTYLVTQVLEQWPDWVSAAVTLQKNN